jgi:hypothetical protein
MAISSSVNPYTSASICLSVASTFGVALEHGLDVRRLPKAPRRGPSTNACGTRMHE